MFSIESSTNAENFTRFERVHCNHGRIPAESPNYGLLLKKVDACISTISSWAEILNIGFDRAKSALQKPLSH